MLKKKDKRDSEESKIEVPEPVDFISFQNNAVRRELFKKYLKQGQFRISETDDAVECYQAILNEYHNYFDTIQTNKESLARS